MTIVSIRFSAAGGGERFRLAEVVGLDSSRPAPLRVRFFDDGTERSVHPNSVAWGVFDTEVAS